MIKLIACDLDGTVFDDHKNIDSGLKEVIDRLREKGIEFTIVSGRGTGILLNVVERLNITVPYMTSNGAVIEIGNERLFTDYIPKELVNTVMKIYVEHGIITRAYGEHGIYAYGESEFFTSRLAGLDRPILPYDPNEDLSDKQINKIAGDFIGHEDLIETVKEEILKYPDLEFTRAEGRIYCVNSSTANKGVALGRVCDYLHIDIKDTMAFGDSENDLEMLKKAGVGVAMANGEEIVKREADYVCGDNNHNGVSTFLKEYFKQIL